MKMYNEKTRINLNYWQIVKLHTDILMDIESTIRIIEICNDEKLKGYLRDDLKEQEEIEKALNNAKNKY